MSRHMIFDAQMKVPVTNRPLIRSASDPDQRFKDLIARAHDERNEAERRTNEWVDRAQAKRHFDQLIRGAEANDETGPGFGLRIDEAFKKYRRDRTSRAASDDPQARLFDQALYAQAKGRALKLEAAARTRDRIVKIGKTIDDLVEAAKANPSAFARLYETGRDALERLNLPPKIDQAFKKRLPEISRSALSALVAQDPQTALDVVRQRAGPADPKFGLTRNVVRLVGKQAEAELKHRAQKETSDKAVGATRALVEAKSTIGAVKRGEAPLSSLSAWIAEGENIGRAGARELRRESDDAVADVEARGQSAATVRDILARGEKLDPDDAEHVSGLDEHHANSAPGRADDVSDDDIELAKIAGMLPKGVVKKIVAQFKSDDIGQAASAASLIAAIARSSPELTKRIDHDVISRVQHIIAASEAGMDWREAVRLERESSDLTPAERAEREQDFLQKIDGAAIRNAIGAKLKVEVVGLTDDLDAPRRVHRRRVRSGR